MLHGSEAWPVRKENEVAPQWAGMRMVRWMSGMKLQDRIPSKGLRERLRLDGIISVLQWNRLRWYGHVLRKEDNDWVKKCIEYEVEGARPRSRPKKTWTEIVKKDCQTHGLNREDAMDRSRELYQWSLRWLQKWFTWVLPWENLKPFLSAKVCNLLRTCSSFLFIAFIYRKRCARSAVFIVHLINVISNKHYNKKSESNLGMAASPPPRQRITKPQSSHWLQWNAPHLLPKLHLPLQWSPPRHHPHPINPSLDQPHSPT